MEFQDQTIQVQQQIIRNRIINFQWETDPNWEFELINIGILVSLYWKTSKKFYGKKRKRA